MKNRKIRLLKWSKNFKDVDDYNYEIILVSIKQSLNELLNIAFKYMFMQEIEGMCFELIETISNIDLMLETEDIEEYNMAKHRVMYMLGNRLEKWYI